MTDVNGMFAAFQDAVNAAAPDIGACKSKLSALKARAIPPARARAKSPKRLQKSVAKTKQDLSVLPGLLTRYARHHLAPPPPVRPVNGAAVCARG